MAQRGKRDKLQVRIEMPSDLMLRMLVEAKRRGMDRDELVSAVLSNVASDDLYAAVLDR